jgi:hypothetical protein
LRPTLAGAVARLSAKALAAKVRAQAGAFPMFFLSERIAHFVRWFFNASPTALLESRTDSPRDRRHSHSTTHREMSR